MSSSEDPKSDSYTLGKFPAPPISLAAPKYGSGSAALMYSGDKVEATLGGEPLGLGTTEGGRYLSMKWEGGTICDKTGMPRTVDVQVRPFSLSPLVTMSDSRLRSSTATLNRPTGSPSFARRRFATTSSLSTPHASAPSPSSSTLTPKRKAKLTRLNVVPSSANSNHLPHRSIRPLPNSF